MVGEIVGRIGQRAEQRAVDQRRRHRLGFQRGEGGEDENADRVDQIKCNRRRQIDVGKKNVAQGRLVDEFAHEGEPDRVEQQKGHDNRGIGNGVKHGSLPVRSMSLYERAGALDHPPSRYALRRGKLAEFWAGPPSRSSRSERRLEARPGIEPGWKTLQGSLRNHSATGPITGLGPQP